MSDPICWFYLRDICKFGDECRFRHTTIPTKWSSYEEFLKGHPDICPNYNSEIGCSRTQCSPRDRTTDCGLMHSVPNHLETAILWLKFEYYKDNLYQETVCKYTKNGLIYYSSEECNTVFIAGAMHQSMMRDISPDNENNTSSDFPDNENNTSRDSTGCKITTPYAKFLKVLHLHNIFILIRTFDLHADIINLIISQILNMSLQPQVIRVNSYSRDDIYESDGADLYSDDYY